MKYIAIYVRMDEVYDANCFKSRGDAEEWLFKTINTFFSGKFSSFIEMIHWFSAYENTPIDQWTEDMHAEYGSDDPGYFEIIEKEN